MRVSGPMWGERNERRGEVRGYERASCGEIEDNVGMVGDLEVMWGGGVAM